MTASPGIVAYVIFTLRVQGRQDQDGTAAASSGATRFLVPFDNTSNFVTSIAFVNQSSATESIGAAFKTASGSVSQATLPSIPAGGHVAFLFPQQFPATAGQSGLAEFYSPSGVFSIIALRANPTGAFTAAPVYPQAGSPILVSGNANGGSLPLQGKIFSLTGTLSLSGKMLSVEMYAVPNGNAYAIEFDDQPSNLSGISFVLGETASLGLSGNTATLTNTALGIQTSIYTDTTNLSQPVIANITASTINITFTSLTACAPLTGSVNFTISGANTPTTTLQGTFTGMINQVE